MNKLIGFLQDDLEELDKSMEDLRNYVDTQKHLDKLEAFVSYWRQHSKSLVE